MEIRIMWKFYILELFLINYLTNITKNDKLSIPNKFLIRSRPTIKQLIKNWYSWRIKNLRFILKILRMQAFDGK